MPGQLFIQWDFFYRWLPPKTCQCECLEEIKHFETIRSSLYVLYTASNPTQISILTKFCFSDMFWSYRTKQCYQALLNLIELTPVNLYNAFNDEQGLFNVLVNRHFYIKIKYFIHCFQKSKYGWKKKEFSIMKERQTEPLCNKQ